MSNKCISYVIEINLRDRMYFTIGSDICTEVNRIRNKIGEELDSSSDSIISFALIKETR